MSGIIIPISDDNMAQTLNEIWFPNIFLYKFVAVLLKIYIFNYLNLLSLKSFSRGDTDLSRYERTDNIILG
jgi:hypothetical protein